MTTVSMAFVESQPDRDTERSDLGILVHLLRVEEKQVLWQSGRGNCLIIQIQIQIPRFDQVPKKGKGDPLFT